MTHARLPWRRAPRRDHWRGPASSSSPPPDARLHAFGLNIRRLREQHGLSLEELAERAGLSFRGLVYIEHGRRNAGILTIFKIADGLELPITALFDYPPPPAESAEA